MRSMLLINHWRAAAFAWPHYRRWIDRHRQFQLAWISDSGKTTFSTWLTVAPDLRSTVVPLTNHTHGSTCQSENTQSPLQAAWRTLASRQCVGHLCRSNPSASTGPPWPRSAGRRQYTDGRLPFALPNLSVVPGFASRRRIQLLFIVGF